MIHASIPETEPHGRDQHEPGAKMDAGKNRPGLMVQDFSRALIAVAEVCTDGAKKYSDSGWLEVTGAPSRYYDALFRHLLAEATGSEVDPKTGSLHAAHAAWNALALLELKLRG